MRHYPHHQTQNLHDLTFSRGIKGAVSISEAFTLLLVLCQFPLWPSLRPQPCHRLRQPWPSSCHYLIAMLVHGAGSRRWAKKRWKVRWGMRCQCCFSMGGATALPEWKQFQRTACSHLMYYCNSLKGLDLNQDSEVDFTEFMSLVARGKKSFLLNEV